VTVYARGGSKPIRTITKGMNGPGALAIDSAGTLYVLTGSLNAVMEYANGGKTLTRVVTSGISAPQQMALGPDGTLYVLNAPSCNPTVTAYRQGTTSVAWTVSIGISCGRSGSFPGPMVLDQRNTLYIGDTGANQYGAVVIYFANGGDNTGEQDVFSNLIIAGPLMMGPP
jgi:hypothetical protein